MILKVLDKEQWPRVLGLPQAYGVGWAEAFARR